MKRVVKRVLDIVVLWYLAFPCLEPAVTEATSGEKMNFLSTALPWQVLGEAYSTHDEEDMAVKEVTAISISQGRLVISVLVARCQWQPWR